MVTLRDMRLLWVMYLLLVEFRYADAHGLHKKAVNLVTYQNQSDYSTSITTSSGYVGSTSSDYGTILSNKLLALEVSSSKVSGDSELSDSSTSAFVGSTSIADTTVSSQTVSNLETSSSYFTSATSSISSITSVSSVPATTYTVSSSLTDSGTTAPAVSSEIGTSSSTFPEIATSSTVSSTEQSSFTASETSTSTISNSDQQSATSSPTPAYLFVSTSGQSTESSVSTDTSDQVSSTSSEGATSSTFSESDQQSATSSPTPSYSTASTSEQSAGSSLSTELVNAATGTSDQVSSTSSEGTTSSTFSESDQQSATSSPTPSYSTVSTSEQSAGSSISTELVNAATGTSDQVSSTSSEGTTSSTSNESDQTATSSPTPAYLFVSTSGQSAESSVSTDTSDQVSSTSSEGATSSTFSESDQQSATSSPTPSYSTVSTSEQSAGSSISTELVNAATGTSDQVSSTSSEGTTSSTSNESDQTATSSPTPTYLFVSTSGKSAESSVSTDTSDQVSSTSSEGTTSSTSNESDKTATSSPTPTYLVVSTSEQSAGSSISTVLVSTDSSVKESSTSQESPTPSTVTTAIKPSTSSSSISNGESNSDGSPSTTGVSTSSQYVTSASLSLTTYSGGGVLSTGASSFTPMSTTGASSYTSAYSYTTQAVTELSLSSSTTIYTSSRSGTTTPMITASITSPLYTSRSASVPTTNTESESYSSITGILTSSSFSVETSESKVSSAEISASEVTTGTRSEISISTKTAESSSNSHGGSIDTNSPSSATSTVHSSPDSSLSQSSTVLATTTADTYSSFASVTNTALTESSVQPLASASSSTTVLVSEASMSGGTTDTVSSSSGFLSNLQSTQSSLEEGTIGTATLLTESSSSEPSTVSTTDWLPSNIITASSTTNSQSTSTFNPDATSTLPEAITPPTPLSEPDGYSLVTIGFKEALNYPFLIDNPLASAQIFSFLPRLLEYPFSSSPGGVAIYKRNEAMSCDYRSSPLTFPLYKRNQTMSYTSYDEVVTQKSSATINLDEPLIQLKTSIKTNSSIDFDEIAVAEIIPLIISGKEYIVSVAVVYFPSGAVNILQQLILNNNSKVYTNPEPSLDSLAQLIDPEIPITGIISSEGSLPGGSTGSGSSSGGGNTSSGSSNGSGGSNGENSSSNDETSGSLDNFTTGTMSFKITKRMLIFLPIFCTAIVAWIIIGLYVMHRLYRQDDIKRHIEVHEKKWSRDDYFDYYLRQSTKLAPATNLHDPEKFAGSEERSTDDSEEDDLVAMGERLFYSKSTGLTYFIDEQGNFFYAGIIEDFERTDTTPAVVSTSDCDPEDYLYNRESQGASENVQSLLDMDVIDVDEDGNIELPITDFEDQEDNQNTNTIESYNNNQYYKMAAYMKNMSPDISGEKEAILSVNTTSPPEPMFETASGTMPISSDSSNPIIQLPMENDDLEDYYWQQDREPSDVPMTSNFSSSKIDGGDVKDYNVDNGEDEDDDVNDVHVGDFDELDEEMYRRLSTISGLNGLYAGSSSSNTYQSILAQQSVNRNHHSGGVSSPSFTRSSSLQGASLSDNVYAINNSNPSSLANTSFWTQVSASPDHSPYHKSSVVTSSRKNGMPKRPNRTSSIISFDKSDDIVISSRAHAADETTSRYYKTSSRIDATKYNSTVHWGTKESESSDLRNTVGRHNTISHPSRHLEDNTCQPNSDSSRRNSKLFKKARKRFSITNSVHASAVLSVGSSHKRSSSTNDVGPRGHTKRDLENIRISGPLFTENSLGWTSMD